MKTFRNTIRASNSLDPHLACFVGPGLGPNSLQRLSTDNTGRQAKSVKALIKALLPLHDFSVSTEYTVTGVCHMGIQLF